MNVESYVTLKSIYEFVIFLELLYRIRRCLVPQNDRHFAKLGGRD